MKRRFTRLLAAKRRQPGQPPLHLGIKSADEALDYVPHMTRLGNGSPDDAGPDQ